jgi:hypothetical protein
MASWSRCNRHGSGLLQTIYINLDHVITVERVRDYTLVKFSDGSETVVEQPEIVVSALQSADERRI